jgi:probable F420-dependent oxidoreductase
VRAAWADADAAREQLGRVGVWSALISRSPATVALPAARRIEELGYSALWLNEGPSLKDPFASAALLLDATERLAVGTGIANIWARDGAAARNAAYTLAEARPGRFTLGLGVSHQPIVDMRGHRYGRPLSAMRSYLDALDAIDWAGPPPTEPVPLVLAALRPKMLELARERTTGAIPYLTPVEHTARARSILGPEPLLAPEVSVAVETDPARARARAREFAAGYLQLPNYTNNLRELGFGDDDLADGGSQRLLDAIVGWGDAHAVASRVHEHLDAGADHVCVQVVGTDLEGALRELAELAPLVLR